MYTEYLYDSIIWRLLQFSLAPNVDIYLINFLQIIDSL